MRKIYAAAAVAMAGFLLAGQAGAGPITTLFSTGVDATGTPLANGAVDPHYTVSAGSGPYAIGNPGSVGWIGNLAGSQWISPDLSTNAGGGPFTYTTTFSLAGLDPSTAAITGQIAADDQATIYLNGVDVFDGSPDATHPWSHFDGFSILTGFVAGLNTLEIYVPNNVESGVSDGPTGLQVSFMGSASNIPAVPEPATIALLGFGLAGIGRLRRRRQRA